MEDAVSSLPKGVTGEALTELCLMAEGDSTSVFTE